MKKTEVWITRNEELFSNEIWVFIGKKPVHESGMFVGPRGSKFVTKFIINEFKSIFGFTPRKDSCKQCNLTLSEVK